MSEHDYEVFGQKDVPGRLFCIRFRNPNLRKWVLFHLVHYLNSPFPEMGLSKRKPLTGNLYERFDEEGEAVRPLLYSRAYEGLFEKHQDDY